jgi:hypothetical protein
MGTTFEDVFDRADGPMGNGWDANVALTISLNKVMTAYWSYRDAVHAAGTGSPDYKAEVHFADQGTWDPLSHFALAARSNSGWTAGYVAEMHPGASGTGSIHLLLRQGDTWTSLATTNDRDYLRGAHTFAVRCTGSLIEVLWDGSVVASATNAAIGSGEYVVCRWKQENGSEFYVDRVTVSVSDAATLSLSRTSVPTDGVALPLTLQGTGTAWTPGVPGSPTFTPSAGTITAQLVLASDLAGVTYNAPSSEQTVTFTDPSTGATAMVDIVDGAPWFDPGGGDPTGLFAFLRRLKFDLLTPIDTVIRAIMDYLTLDGEESLLGYARTLGAPPEGETFASLLAALQTKLDYDANDPSTISSQLVTILTELYATNGYPTRHTIGEILTAIGEVTAPDLSTITDAIGGVSDQVIDVATTLGMLAGTPVTSTADLFTAIGSVQTDVGVVGATADGIDAKMDALTGTGTYNLAGELAATGVVGALATAGLIVAIIGLVRGTAATAIQTVALVEDVVSKGTNWAAIAGSVLGFLSDYAVPSPTALSTDLTTLINDVLGVHDDLGTDLTTITDAISGSETDLDSKLDAMDGKLDTILDELGRMKFGGSLWPGDAYVTMGTPVAITESMRIDGPLEGIVYNLTSVPLGTLTSDIGGKPSYMALGLVAFESDRGHMERFQTISFKNSLVVPMSMLSAAACVLEWRPGTVGTVTAWVRTT